MSFMNQLSCQKFTAPINYTRLSCYSAGIPPPPEYVSFGIISYSAVSSATQPEQTQNASLN